MSDTTEEVYLRGEIKTFRVIKKYYGGYRACSYKALEDNYAVIMCDLNKVREVPLYDLFTSRSDPAYLISLIESSEKRSSANAEKNLELLNCELQGLKQRLFINNILMVALCCAGTALIIFN